MDSALSVAIVVNCSSSLMDINYYTNRIACVYCAVSSHAIILKLHSFNSLRHSNIQ